MRDHFIKRLTELTANDRRIMLLTGDLGFKVFDDYRETYPENFLNVGVAEQNMTGLATGLAREGKIVFTYSIANFSTLRCLEQIRNDASYHDADVKVVSIGGGFSYGALGISHHATEDLAILRALPGVTVVSPCTLYEAYAATEALVETPGTFYFRLDKSHGEDPHGADLPFELGKARRLREGGDITFIVTGGILEEVQQAADDLARNGIDCRILSMPTIYPIDSEAIVDAAESTGGIVTVEEHTRTGGLGGAVAEVLLDAGAIPHRFARLGLGKDFAAAVGSQKYLRQRYGLSAQHIVEKTRTLIQP